MVRSQLTSALGWRFGSEVDDDVAVGLGVQVAEAVVDARVGVVGLQQGAGLGVVDVDRPERLDRDRRREGERVVLGAVEGVAVGVVDGVGVLRADAGRGVGHRRGDAGADVVHQGAVVEHPRAVGEELVAAADEGGLPRRALEDVDVGVTRLVQQGAGDPGPDPGRLVEDVAHAGRRVRTVDRGRCRWRPAARLVPGRGRLRVLLG